MGNFYWGCIALLSEVLKIFFYKHQIIISLLAFLLGFEFLLLLGSRYFLYYVYLLI